MSFRDTLRQILSVWMALIVLGFVMMVGGCTQTLRFLNAVPMYKVLTARQLVQQLIIPHMIMLCGMGLLVGSAIFMARHAVIQIRMKHEEV